MQTRFRGWRRETGPEHRPQRSVPPLHQLPAVVCVRPLRRAGRAGPSRALLHTLPLPERALQAGQSDGRFLRLWGGAESLRFKASRGKAGGQKLSYDVSVPGPALQAARSDVSFWVQVSECVTPVQHQACHFTLQNYRLPVTQEVRGQQRSNQKLDVSRFGRPPIFRGQSVFQ